MARVLPGCDYVVNFAAETHVDRSLYDAGGFIQTDVYGAFVLLEEARRSKELQAVRADLHRRGVRQRGEGLLAGDGRAHAAQPLLREQGGRRTAWPTPTSRPTALPVMVTRASNNYGPYQFPEKVIPLFVTHAIDDIPVPLYGDGLNVRDWLHVDDHCRAVDFLLERGRPGETYNVGGGNEVPNIDLTRRILSLVGKPESLIKRVPDRPGHDRRYSLDCGKLRAMGWAPRCRSRRAWRGPSRWYRQHEAWWRPLKEADPAFREHYQRHYGER